MSHRVKCDFRLSAERLPTTSNVALAPNIDKVLVYDKAGKGQWIKVEEPTMAQRLLYGGATDGALWVSLFELANLKMRLSEEKNLTAGLGLVNGSYYELAAKGESLSAGIRRVTGKTATTKTLTEVQDKQLILQLSQISTKPRVLSVGSKTVLPKEARVAGIVSAHAYAVIDYTPANGGRITLRNPHNRSDVTGGKDVVLTLKQFRDWFAYISSDSWVG